jgi:hypothetical protein
MSEQRIKITIKPNTKTAKAFKKYLSEKEAFKEAVKAGQEVEEPKKWSEMTLEEKRAFYLSIFANPSGYANPDRPFYC